jgi:hypothetical protein
MRMVESMRQAEIHQQQTILSALAEADDPVTYVEFLTTACRYFRR